MLTWLIINEIEGQAITGESAPEAMLEALARRAPELRVVLTLGAGGSVYRHGDLVLTQARYEVPVRDTTAAGDTFLGYFIQEASPSGWRPWRRRWPCPGRAPCPPFPGGRRSCGSWRSGGKRTRYNIETMEKTVKLWGDDDERRPE